MALGDNIKNANDELNKFQNNLVKLVNQAKNFSKDIAFIGLTKVDQSSIPKIWDTEKFYDNNVIAKYDSIIKRVSSENDLPFLDLLDLIEPKDLDDGLHPNTEGHKKMFLKVKDFLFSIKYVQ